LAQSLKDAVTWSPRFIADAFGSLAPARQPLHRTIGVLDRSGLADTGSHGIACNNMADNAADRIERALARIEAAAAARAYASARLARRHQLLRARIEDAITSLDVLIARESETPESE
jgi:hypothetical protein